MTIEGSTTTTFAGGSAGQVERAAPAVGDVLVNGRFELLRLLGEGGLGTVFLARDRRTGRHVAFKTLIPRYVGRPEREQRLFDELRYLESIEDRRHVVAPIDGGRLPEIDGWPYLVMEHIEGESLLSKLLSGEPLPLADALEISTQVAVGLRAIHVARVVHRDLTPGNILLHREGDALAVKIIDFSHAASADGPRADVGDGRRLTRINEVPGTATYMPPEQAQTVAADFPMDVFAFGIVMYEMLTGRNPFGLMQREHYIALQQHDAIEVDPIDPRTCPLVPKALLDLVNRCVRSRADERPTVERILARLRISAHDTVGKRSATTPVTAEPTPARPEILDVVAVEATPNVVTVGPWTGSAIAKPEVTAAAEPPRTRNHRPLAAMLGAAIVLLGLGVLSRAFWPSRSHDEPPAAPRSDSQPSSVTAAPEPAAGSQDDPVPQHPAEAAPPDPTEAESEPQPPEPSEVEPLEPTPPEPPATDTKARAPRPGTKPRRRDPQPEPAAEPSCDGVPEAVAQARASRRWSEVLRESKDRACWAKAPAEILAARAQALMELSRWAECVRLADESADPKVRFWTDRCRTRLDTHEVEP